MRMAFSRQILSTCSCVRSFISSSATFLVCGHVESTAQRVRELGGQVLSTASYESGGNAECVDDQGLRFDLFRPRPGY